MTANQRRPGFRLPWSSETDGPEAAGDAIATDVTASAAPDAAATAAPAGAPSAPAELEQPAPDANAPVEPAADAPASAAEAAAPAAAAAQAEAAAPAEAEAPTEPAVADAGPSESPAPSGDDFMRDLIAAMRGVADEARQAGITELKARADEQIQRLEADAEQRRNELRARADADVAGVAEWERSEAERIKREAEQRVVARRAELDQELEADASRTEAETRAVRDRVAEYERELEAYHAQLAEINDPAAFAAAAKRLPRPPALEGRAAAATTPEAEPAATPTPAEHADASPGNGVPSEPQPTASEVLARRLAALDASLPEAEPTASGDDGAANDSAPAEQAALATAADPVPASSFDRPAAPVAESSASPAAAVSTEPAMTEVVVKGLGSFGAITGFRQSLSGVEGVESVALSLGQTGEFVFRATHAAGFDMRAAIHGLEGDGATIEDRPEGGLRVTLERAR